MFFLTTTENDLLQRRCWWEIQPTRQDAACFCILDVALNFMGKAPRNVAADSPDSKHKTTHTECVKPGVMDKIGVFFET